MYVYFFSSINIFFYKNFLKNNFSKKYFLKIKKVIHTFYKKFIACVVDARDN